MDNRLKSLKHWLNQIITEPIHSIAPASADASFRRYFRIELTNSTLIAMDAPPEHEDNPKFTDCAATLLACDINVPVIHQTDFENGFLLISDLGTKTYQQALNTKSAESLYQDAIDSLIKLQKGTSAYSSKHPKYDNALLLEEMALFEPWYIETHLKRTLSKQQKTDLRQVFEILIENALLQPQVLVHRDFHCRNLLLTETNNPGVIDFQDMVVGAASYDLVSLLKDCYIEWPNKLINELLEYYLKSAYAEKLILEDFNLERLRREFDLMGVQRHLKVLGIFARLFYRDGKSQYLDDIPLVKKYIINVCADYPELQPLLSIFENLET